MAAVKDEAKFAFAVSVVRPTMTKYAKQDYATFLMPSRPYCVVIDWTYAPNPAPSEGGLQEEYARVSVAIEAQRMAHVDSVIVLSSMSLSGDEGLWLIYAASGAELGRALLREMGSLSSSQARVRVVEDVEWKVYERYVAWLTENK